MEIFGIKFVPLNVPLQRRLETLSAGIAFFLVSLFGLVGPLVVFYLLFTRVWPLAVAYLIWIWLIDTEIWEKGGRSLEWVRNWTVWHYAKSYYPVSLITPADLDLDPKRNYLFCCFPHGVFATGVVIALSSRACNSHKLFPNHKIRGFTLTQNFFMPLYRDFFLSMGICSVSPKCINWTMGSPNGGHIGIVVVGGAAESVYAKPGDYHLVLKNRKGFVKLAIKNGCPLVPVFTFGEIELFDQINNTLLFRFQNWIKSKTRIFPIVPIGRGIFQYSFGMIPRRRPLNVVVGRPIDVEMKEQPTQNDIDTLHDLFIKELTKLFEENKTKYIENPESTQLIIH